MLTQKNQLVISFTRFKHSNTSRKHAEMETSTVTNPTRFVTNRSNASRSSYTSEGLIDSSKDIDLVFLKAVKECRIKWNSIALIQCLPSTPLTDFHLHWLIYLADQNPESHSIIQHIFNQYKIECDPVILDYYKLKLARVCERVNE